MCKREWYMKCRTCGAFRRGIIDVLEPCPGCGQVTMWEKVFWVEYACGGNGKKYRDPKIEKDLEREESRQKGKDDF